MSPIRLLIVDDHPVVRDGLRGMFTRIPEFEAVGEAANGVEAVAVAESLRPDVILMDLRMPGGDGTTAIRELSARTLPARVLVLTTYDGDIDVVPAIQAGATRLPAEGLAPRGAVSRGARCRPWRVRHLAGGRCAADEPAAHTTAGGPQRV